MITVSTLGQAHVVAEIPEALSGWNLLAIANTEHPRGSYPPRQSGAAVAGEWGLVTARDLVLSTTKSRLEIAR